MKCGQRDSELKRLEEEQSYMMMKSNKPNCPPRTEMSYRGRYHSEEGLENQMGGCWMVSNMDVQCFGGRKGATLSVRY